MLGSFNMPSIGSFVVSGDTPEEFLWDLFDQIVVDGHRKVNTGAIDITIKNKNGFSQDHQERLDARETQGWRESHSNYFCTKIGSGVLIYGVDIPSSLLFNFHKVSLLGALINEVGNNLNANMIKTNIARSNHGHGTKEFLEATKDLTWHDYPYGDLEASSLIEYMINKEILKIRSGAPVTLTKPVPARKDSRTMEQLKQEQRQAAIESKQRQKKIRAPKPAK